MLLPPPPCSATCPKRDGSVHTCRLMAVWDDDFLLEVRKPRDELVTCSEPTHHWVSTPPNRHTPKAVYKTQKM